MNVYYKLYDRIAILKFSLLFSMALILLKTANPENISMLLYDCMSNRSENYKEFC